MVFVALIDTDISVASSGSINAASLFLNYSRDSFNTPESSHVIALSELEPPTRQGRCCSYSKCMFKKKSVVNLTFTLHIPAASYNLTTCVALVFPTYLLISLFSGSTVCCLCLWFYQVNHMAICAKIRLNTFLLCGEMISVHNRFLPPVRAIV